MLISESELVEITESVQACRDPKDDRILELAISGNASLIITGDKELLVLQQYQRIQIATPADFAKLEQNNEHVQAERQLAPRKP